MDTSFGVYLDKNLRHIFDERPNANEPISKENLSTECWDKNEELEQSALLEELFSSVFDTNDEFKDWVPPEESYFPFHRNDDEFEKSIPPEEMHSKFYGENDEVKKSDILDEVDYILDTNMALYAKMYQETNSAKDVPEDLDDLTDFLNDINDEFSNLERDHREYELENAILSLTEYDLNDVLETSYRTIPDVHGRTYITQVERKKKLIAIKSLSQPTLGSPLRMREKLLNTKIEKFEKALQAFESKYQDSELVPEKAKNGKKQGMEIEEEKILNLEGEMESKDQVLENSVMLAQYSMNSCDNVDTELTEYKVEYEKLQQENEVLEREFQQMQIKFDLLRQKKDHLELEIAYDAMRQQKANLDQKIEMLKESLKAEQERKKANEAALEELKNNVLEEQRRRMSDIEVIENLKQNWRLEKKLREVDAAAYNEKFDSLIQANENLQAAALHAASCKRGRSCSICFYSKCTVNEVDDNPQKGKLFQRFRSPVRSIRTWLRPSNSRIRTSSDSRTENVDRTDSENEGSLPNVSPNPISVTKRSQVLENIPLLSDSENEGCLPNVSPKPISVTKRSAVLENRPLSSDSGVSSVDDNRKSRSSWRRMSGFWSKPDARESDQVLTRSRLTSSFRKLISRKSMPNPQ